MIYTTLKPTDDIRQGDIFKLIPRIEIDFSQFVRIKDDKIELSTSDWLEVVAAGQAEGCIVAVKPVFGIVVTPDCDALRSSVITFCEIDDFKIIEPKCRETSAANKWVNIITQHSRVNQKWFYLPPEKTIGFDKKMAADFRLTIRLERHDAERFKTRLRIGRLNEMSTEHFRNRVGEFFRRYPYDEWYALDKNEAAAYKEAKGESIQLYPGQE